jgi:gamma-glutamylcyclotransferase
VLQLEIWNCHHFFALTNEQQLRQLAVPLGPCAAVPSPPWPVLLPQCTRRMDPASPEWHESSQESQDSVMTLMDENRAEVLYFAYGSNLSTAQMRQRCPFSTPIGLGRLSGWRWIVNERGFANIVQQPTLASAQASRGATGGDAVIGLLYLVPQEDEERLDRYEGVPSAYQKIRQKVVWTHDSQGKPTAGEMLEVLVYVDGLRVDGGCAPREEYVVRMETGLSEAVADWGMDESYAGRLRSALNVK